MKRIYFVAISILLFSSACNSPNKKQHENKLQKANTFQNNSAEATTKPENMIGSGNLTDSTHTDTGIFRRN